MAAAESLPAETPGAKAETGGEVQLSALRYVGRVSDPALAGEMLAIVELHGSSYLLRPGDALGDFTVLEISTDTLILRGAGDDSAIRLRLAGAAAEHGEATALPTQALAQPAEKAAGAQPQPKQSDVGSRHGDESPPGWPPTEDPGVATATETPPADPAWAIHVAPVADSAPPAQIPTPAAWLPQPQDVPVAEERVETPPPIDAALVGLPAQVIEDDSAGSGGMDAGDISQIAVDIAPAATPSAAASP